MKRALSFFLSIVICFTFIVETKQIFSKADRNETSAENKEPALNAKCAIVMEKSTERILFQKNLSLAAGKYFHRVPLADSHRAADFLWNYDSA